jgi:hypothetical protein
MDKEKGKQTVVRKATFVNGTFAKQSVYNNKPMAEINCC